MRSPFAPLTALVALVAVAVVPACGFPDLSYDTDGGSSSGGDATSAMDGSGGDTGSDGTSSDGEPLGDASSDVAGDTGPSVGDSSSTIDSGSHDSSMPPHDSGDPCDVDGDGYRAVSCGGNDCCDNDALAHPGVTTFYPSKDGCMSFDYNCDGTLETEWGAFSCAPGVTGCTPTSGFVGGVPGCAVSQQWTGTCTNMITSCQPGTTISQTQACH